MNGRLTIKETAKLVGGSEAWVRSLCDRGLIGDSWGNGKHRKTYVVVFPKLAKFLEVEPDVLYEMVALNRESEVR